MIERKKFPISILIVDDEPTIVEQLSLILGRRVEVFFTASNGAEGYECYKRESPDLIISDIDMPVMNGIEFLKLVRADDRHKPFILSTGLKSLDILIEAIEQGITAFLPKPLQIHTLIAKIEEVAHTKELELAIKNSTLLLDQYKQIVDDSVIVSKTDQNGIINFVNDMFCSVSGYTREELIGQPHNIVRDPSMPSSIYKGIWQTIQAKKIWQGLIHNRAKDGSKYTVKSTISPILDSEGNILEYIALREDITALEHAKEAAILAAKIKGDFLANMSHEIRTPMNGILGFTDLLSRSNLNEQQKRYLGIIENSTKTLLGIVNDILDFSKIESGKLELNCTQINTFIEFQNISQLFTARMDEKQIQFEVLIDPRLNSYIFIDLLRIQQVVSNLLSNALKFTPEHGKITFYTTSLGEVNNEVHLRIGVRDNGIGISQSNQKKIFESFSQADNSVTREFGGTGLGLSISSDLVALMGGELKVESQTGEGSHFYFDIKVNTGTTPVVATVETSEDSKKFTGNVLVAEDNDVNQVLIEEYLRRYQLNFTIVDNGQKALDELGKNTYDLLLLDINMPVMSGMEVISIMRKEGNTTAVIALTANVMQGDKEKYLESGFNNYLSKPIVIKQLENIFETYLSHTPSKQDESVFDFKFLQQELDLPEKIIFKLLSVFLKSSDTNLLELKTAIDEHDIKTIEKIAHKIRGAAGNMRFYAIEELAGKIEMLARDDEPADYEALYHRFEEAMKKIQEEIERLFTAAERNNV